MKTLRIVFLLFLLFPIIQLKGQINIEWINPTVSIRDLALSENSIYIITKDSILKIEQNGNIDWRYKHMLPGIMWLWGFEDIEIDSAKNIYISGAFKDTIANIGRGFIIKYSSSGDTIWSLFDVGYNNIELDNSGYIYAGSYFAKVTPNGNLLWTTNKGGYIEIDSSDNIYLGRLNAGNCFQIEKLDTGGNSLWTYTHTNDCINTMVEALGITWADKYGNTYAAGWQMNACGFDQDYYAIKVDCTGTLQWTACYNGTGNFVDKAYALAVDNEGNVYLTGESCPPGNCSLPNTIQDMVTVKYDSNGVQQWVQRYSRPGGGYAHGYDIAIDDSGYIYVIGATANATGDSDGVVIIKYAQNGNIVWTFQSAEYWAFYVASEFELDRNYNIYCRGGNYLVKFCQYSSKSYFIIDTLNAFSGDTSLFINTSWNASWWQWDYGNGGGIDSINYDGAVIYDTAGTYTIALIAWNGCGKDTMQQTVAVQKGCNYLQAAFTLPNDTVEMSDTVQFTFTGSDAAAWLWNFGDGTYDTLQNPTHVYDSTGTYSVMLAVANNYNGLCVDTVYSTVTVVLPVAVQEIEKAVRITHRPNPATGEVVFTFTLPSTSHATLQLFNILGGGIATVYDGKTHGNKAHRINFDVSELEGGMYFYRLETEDGNIVRRMAVVK